MTGLMHEKEFSRKSFVKGGGALIISFSALGAAGAASAATGNTPFNSRTPNDFLPDLQQVDSWIAVTTDNKIIVTHGEPEFAGTPTGSVDSGVAIGRTRPAPFGVTSLHASSWL